MNQEAQNQAEFQIKSKNWLDTASPTLDEAICTPWKGLKHFTKRWVMLNAGSDRCWAFYTSEEGKLAEWWVHECLLSFSFNLFKHLEFFIIHLKQTKVQNKWTRVRTGIKKKKEKNWNYSDEHFASRHWKETFQHSGEERREGGEAALPCGEKTRESPSCPFTVSKKLETPTAQEPKLSHQPVKEVSSVLRKETFVEEGVGISYRGRSLRTG